MESRAVNVIYPLIDYLLSCYMDSDIARIKSQDAQDLHWLKMGFTRFMDAANDTHTFERENPELLSALERCVSGQFSHVTGREWRVGEPMHLSHLVNALLRKISVLDKHYVEEFKETPKLGIVWPLSDKLARSGERFIQRRPTARRVAEK